MARQASCLAARNSRLLRADRRMGRDHLRIRRAYRHRSVRGWQDGLTPQGRLRVLDALSRFTGDKVLATAMLSAWEYYE